MVSLTIEKDFLYLQNEDGAFRNSTLHFWGNALAMLENAFPASDYKKPEFWVENFVKAANDDQKATMIWGMQEFGNALYSMYTFIDGRNIIKITREDIERLRITHNMTANFLPTNLADISEGMRFDNLSNVTQVLIAILYYYEYHGYSLVKCKHCGKWFATKSQKNEYCGRTSPCYNLVVCGKKVLGSKRTCNDAVGIIKQRLADRKKQIYNKWYAEGLEDECFELNERFYQYKMAIKENPTVENITACMIYLYSPIMPAQERPNRRKSNAERRRLLGR